MFNLLSGLFGPKTDFKDLVNKGAIIVDVRTKSEFSSGQIPQSINIPVDQIQTNIKKIAAYKKPIITCCASGMRSSAAASALTKAGIEAYNGGPWSSLQQAIR
jgi:phage shock protein E